MNARTAVLLALALGALALFVGCGSDDEDATAGGSAASEVTTSSLDKKQFVKEGNAACKEERKGLVKEATTYMEQNSGSGKPEPVVFADMVKTVVLPTIEDEMAALRALGAPEGDEEQVEAILAAELAAVDEAKQLQKASTFEVVERYFKDAAELANDYGLFACANA